LSRKNQDFIYTGKGEYTEKGKDKLRLQVVKWFMENKKGNIYIFTIIRYNLGYERIEGDHLELGLIRGVHPAE
jgi:hypothetical protein